MSKLDNQEQTAKVFLANQRSERVSANDRPSRLSGVFLRNRQDFIRAFVMHEILAEPKCKLGSFRKQY